MRIARTNDADVDADIDASVDDEPVELNPRDAVRVDPETTRQLVLHGDSLLVADGAS